MQKNNICEETRTFRSINLHLIGACNYSCSHCFARSLSRKFLTGREWGPILDYLKTIGIEKINFAGGEPTFYPHLKEVCTYAKSLGFTTSIVSNSSRMDRGWFEEFDGLMDWVGLSVDSTEEDDEILIGRHCQGVNHLENIRKVSILAHEFGMKVKLNITVLRRSWDKDFHGLITSVKPERVKVFRALTLEGANDDMPDTWSITDEQFDSFKRIHKDCENTVFEDNDDMVGTYLMMDPEGRWMLNTGKTLHYLPFEVLKNEGYQNLLDVEGYFERNGYYKWN